MKQIERFFRRYILSTVGILLSFFAINLLLFIVLISVIIINKTKMDNFPISAFSQYITIQNGTPSADSRALELLQQEKAWAMILDASGTVIWEQNLPKELPRSYSVPETAVFSRWYLQDYPVTVRTLEDRLLVVGLQPGSVFKYNISVTTNYIRFVLAGISAAFFINLFLMLYLSIRNTRRIERSMRPILDGIRALSQGNPCKLEERGELAEINAGLNKAGDYLMKKDNTRAEWIRGISHDIRTPLSMVLGYASEIEDTSGLPENTRKQAAIIRMQGEKLKQIVTDLNLATKLEYSMQPIRNQKLDPVELVRQVISEFLNHGLPEQYDIDFAGAQPDEPFLICADSSLFQRMLVNLIRNCIVHNPAGCKITVSVLFMEAYCCFIVQDNGCGISKPLLEQLNHYGSISSTQEQTAEPEHGLGLKIVRQIARVHQGIVLFSDVYPHGLSVRIKMPII